MSRYVRSKYSVDATIWKLDAIDPWNEELNGPSWRVNDNGHFHYLPRGEYIEVASMEWHDVTGKLCIVNPDLVFRDIPGRVAKLPDGHRWMWAKTSNGMALRIERLEDAP